MRSIYLDYNATTPIAPRAQEAMLPFLSSQYGNPVSDHAFGRAAAQAVEDARFRVATAIGASPEEVFFTTSATESCRLALGADPRRDVFDAVVSSNVEHRAVSHHVDADCRVACDARGVVAPEAFEALLTGAVRTVSVTHANNEIGTVQPLAEVSEAVRGYDVWLHSDATQSFGKIPVNVDTLGVDLLTITSHKAYGPKGAAALYLRRGVPIGATDNNGCTLSLGTADVAAIAGFGYAAEVAAASVEESAPRMASLRDRLLERLRDGAGDDLTVWGEGAERLPNTLAVSLPGVAGDDLLAACPEVCATPLGSGDGDRVRLASTLEAIGADPAEARGAIRLSVGWFTDADEVDRAAALLLESWERCRAVN